MKSTSQSTSSPSRIPTEPYIAVPTDFLSHRYAPIIYSYLFLQQNNLHQSFFTLASLFNFITNKPLTTNYELLNKIKTDLSYVLSYFNISINSLKPKNSIVIDTSSLFYSHINDNFIALTQNEIMSLSVLPNKASAFLLFLFLKNGILTNQGRQFTNLPQLLTVSQYYMHDYLNISRPTIEKVVNSLIATRLIYVHKNLPTVNAVIHPKWKPCIAYALEPFPDKSSTK